MKLRWGWLLWMLVLLCGCTQVSYARMDRTPVALDEDLFLSQYRIETTQTHLPKGATAYTLCILAKEKRQLECLDWTLQRFYDGQWYGMQDTGGTLAVTVEAYREETARNEEITVCFPPLPAGYYRVAITVREDGEPGVMCAGFTVGALEDFAPADLPASDREITEKAGVQLTVPQRVGYGATEVLYQITTGGGGFQTGCSAYLEREVYGQWCQLPASRLGFPAVATLLGGGETCYERLCLGSYLHPLEPGHYRIVKDGKGWNGKTVYVAGEFDVWNIPKEDFATPVPEGLSMSVTAVEGPRPADDRRRAINRWWVELTIENLTEQRVFLRSDAVSYLLEEAETAEDNHDHPWRVDAGQTNSRRVRLDRVNGEPLFGGDGGIQDGSYRVTRRATFEDGQYCTLECTFTVKDGNLVD